MAKKSETRIAFEKTFAAERSKRIKAGNPGDGGTFMFRGKKYTTDYAKKAKKEKKKVEKAEFWNPTASKTSKYAGRRRKKTPAEKKSGKAPFRFGHGGRLHQHD